MSDNKPLPLIAILRGLTPDTAIQSCEVLINEGFSQIEVPLNSPDALKSIQLLVARFGDQYLIGAGTVTTKVQAQAVIDTGAKLIVSPNYNSEVIKLGVQAGCTVLPGVLTPTEAFAALADGASGLKLFPANVVGLAGFKALMSVLPANTACFPVGGISASVESMRPFVDAGAAGFGIGASLYTPQMSLEQIANNAREFVSTFKSLS
ncbi:2-dehydro-3-deoxy-6-phosphogalactonate aldolase [Alginatibacterium sediminis]|uniref:2-dehydro-3-deoxy-6-phosphogalactonate aldolase n=1 Tax=Alginatibacterium sediminis TaxID=2164068 RepID=A0A420EB50_9ALTE|nr:2-dehydro-3-deoxy-6-phosphogalactonate aldolase [Alginatibacterium sediminis]RKF17917.1 2-dehydro-3-deoxy-6-phosphogalactonate aldolase [Alginatibacterium sediminis]